MRYIIITGTSRGIGEALAREFLSYDNTLICTSRSANEDLIETASGLGVPLYYHESDISRPDSANAFIKEAFRIIDFNKAQAICLINNAGILEPMGPSGSLSTRKMEQHIRTNLLAPAILINSFIKLAAKAAILKVILNMSSGASEYSYFGWSLYCSSKAGLDMLTRTVALEQESAKNPVKLFALKPGIVETPMQQLIRNTKTKQFRDREKFVKLFNDGLLASPQSVAEVVAQTIFSPAIAQGSLLTLAQLKELTAHS